MPLPTDPFQTVRMLPDGQLYYALPALAQQLNLPLRQRPVSIRILLESLLRCCDGKRVKEEDVRQLAAWNPSDASEVPFVVSRVILQDFTGVPLLVDLAAMRDAAAALGTDPAVIEPVVPVDLVVDHSVQVDRAASSDAYTYNLDCELARNHERYAFLRWGQTAFKNLRVVPPGVGIVHQVNLEYLASVVTCHTWGDQTLLSFDTLVGTDSHTTMINGLGVLGWGVGGIEAEAALLGQPYFLQMPEVIGVYLKGELGEGVTATDVTLCITQLLRHEKVVGKFVEFFGPGAAHLSVVDRATIANMAPEYGATVGFFSVDEKTLDYLRMTGRSADAIALVEAYWKAQEVFGIANRGEISFTREVELDLSSVLPSVAGPKRPQDRIFLPDLKERLQELLLCPVAEGGYGLSAVDGVSQAYLRHGSVVIAAITSCTNTSNPSVMLGAGLLAKKAVEKGLTVPHWVKTSLAPGSRVVTDYLERTGLQPYLDALGFNLVAYGCTTCIGNSGPLDEHIEQAIHKQELIVASVSSGNRNFEARIHESVKANFLMSPPLVVAFAIAGRVDIDLFKEPLGYDTEGRGIFLQDIWPSNQEIEQKVQEGVDSTLFKKRYAHVFEGNQAWENMQVQSSARYMWNPESTYVQHPPFFEGFSLKRPLRPTYKNMRALALWGDSVTTDHISPAGGFKENTPAGQYLLSQGLKESTFNTYGSRRGNHFVMMRGTFANVRIRNHMLRDKEGGWTLLMPEKQEMTLFEASRCYAKRHVPLILFAGADYGMGSSRDWAAKGTALLGVRAVVAQSFERIHRSNLVGMGVLPLEFTGSDSWQSLGIQGDELFCLHGLDAALSVQQPVTLEIERSHGKKEYVALKARLDTPIDIEYYLQGGILPYVLRQLMSS